MGPTADRQPTDTQTDTGRPGSAVRMFVPPFVATTDTYPLVGVF